MVKYTREQRLRAVRLYEQYDRSAASVINELGYPSRQMLVRWHRAWVEAGRCLCSIRDCGLGVVHKSWTALSLFLIMP